MIKKLILLSLLICFSKSETCAESDPQNGSGCHRVIVNNGHCCIVQYIKYSGNSSPSFKCSEVPFSTLPENFDRNTNGEKLENHIKSMTKEGWPEDYFATIRCFIDDSNFIEASYAKRYDCNYIQTPSVKDCTAVSLPNQLKCCYDEYKGAEDGGEGKECDYFEPEEYNDLNAYIEELKEDLPNLEMKIDCGSESSSSSSNLQKTTRLFLLLLSVLIA